MELSEYSYSEIDHLGNNLSKRNRNIQIYPRIEFNDKESKIEKWFDFCWEIDQSGNMLTIKLTTFICINKSRDTQDKFLYMSNSIHRIITTDPLEDFKSIITEIVHSIYSIMIYTINNLHNEKLKEPSLKAIYEHTDSNKEHYNWLSSLFKNTPCDIDLP